jgi:membrane-anchored protein YejM (alkaline phosphatase superfamily)
MHIYASTLKELLHNAMRKLIQVEEDTRDYLEIPMKSHIFSISYFMKCKKLIDQYVTCKPK